MSTEHLAERLRELFREHGIINAYDLESEMRERFGPDVPRRQTIERILEGETQRPRRATVQRLDDFFEQNGSLVGELADEPGTHSHKQHQNQRFAGRWFEYIPAQPNRDYETVDAVEIEQRGDAEAHCSLSVRRLFSTRRPNDEQQEWVGEGVLRDNRFLLLYFVSISDDRPDSNGVIAVRRVGTFRRLEGFYVRFRDETDRDDLTPPVFHLTWFRDADEIDSDAFRSRRAAGA